MPEGDTIRTAANRVGAALIGRAIESIETPHPRFGKDQWPQKLAGRGVRTVYLEVRASNAAARQLYESLGFGAVARRSRYYRRPVEDAVILRAAIPAEGGSAIL